MNHLSQSGPVPECPGASTGPSPQPSPATLTSTAPSTGGAVDVSDWYSAGNGILMCFTCFFASTFPRGEYTALETPLADLEEDSACIACGAHPCRWCGCGVVPAELKFCGRHAHFCERCDGGGETGDPNHETPERCTSCNGSGRAMCRACKTRRAVEGSLYCAGCEWRVEEARLGLA